MSLQQQILNYITHRQGHFNELALAVFAYQFEHCLPYQTYCRQLNKTPDTLTQWQQIPPVSTDVFREAALCTLPLESARHVFQTSGTSQEIKGKHYYHDFTLYDAAIQHSFMKGLSLSTQDKVLFRILTPCFVDAPHSSLCYMFQKALEWYGAPGSRFYFTQNEMDDAQLLEDLQKDSEENRRIVLLGTAFSYVNFCDYLLENHIQLKLPSGSRLLETGGLKGRSRSVSRAELYQSFVNLLGLDLNYCFSEYGMTELSSQCYSLANSHLFYSPQWMPTLIINPETGNEVAIGETGLVQFFDLANYTAVSAIMTSDLAIRHTSGFELQGRAPKAALRGCSTVYEK